MNDIVFNPPPRAHSQATARLSSELQSLNARPEPNTQRKEYALDCRIVDAHRKSEYLKCVVVVGYILLGNRVPNVVMFVVPR